MLSSLTIRNFAIIRSLDLELGPGLNVLTGETGAGKSIILGALNAILGGKCGAEIIRTGAERATVDALFDTSNSPSVQKICEDLGYPLEDGSLLLSREINSAGKSSIRIGGRPATIAQLREIGQWLVDLHGQHEHQSLLSVARHVEILDEWAGKPVELLRREISGSWRECRVLEAKIRELETDSREREQMLDLYGFQSGEIRAAELTLGEEELLVAETRRLANGQRLVEAVSTTIDALQADDEGGLKELFAASKKLQDASLLDSKLGELSSRVSSALLELEEVSHDLARYRDEIGEDEASLNGMEERLDQIRTLKRKYGDDIPSILAYAESIETKLETIQNSDELRLEAQNKLARGRAELNSLCAELSKLRRAAALEFSSLVLTELHPLAMERARFEVQILDCEPSEKGADKVEFMIAPNPGEPLRPLVKIASGGEVSRVMLAIKSAMSGKESLPTMVFDEIDVGVGGRTAATIADKLAGLAEQAQIICITHLAQIAGRAQHHYYIEKTVTAERTETTVTRLPEELRINEIARMLAGTAQTDAVRQHALELLSMGKSS